MDIHVDKYPTVTSFLQVLDPEKAASHVTCHPRICFYNLYIKKLNKILYLYNTNIVLPLFPSNIYSLRQESRKDRKVYA